MIAAALALLAASAALPTSLPVDAATLARLPVASATLTAHGKNHACTGVWLADLAAAAGLPAGEALRGPALTTLIMAEAADGYRVAFSLAGLDPKLGNHPVLVANACDGKALDESDGPLRLVVPGEVRAARSVRQIRALRVVALP
ncbi:molybdopterin-dependent oxidoreductase [Sandarakinorhabdus limnophila]|uniref:molybdopterin-dependent oxidoreductase n=1 Tax=Sandarakinorhabdus limnophila TaxID=210512 RepID=UPI0026F13BF9|nr:molybdopterin-dependent oxidoreductase [Sandarakinorhabdus limnophila]